MSDELEVCSKCNGKGTLDISDDPTKHVKSCPKCLGIGKLDWVENVVGKNPFRIWGSRSSEGSPLHDVNVRRLINYIKETIEEVCASNIIDCSASIPEIEKFLENLQSKKAIFDFRISCDPWVGKHVEGTGKRIDVYIRPVRAPETIVISTVVKNGI